jgi:hypothetical protein
MCRWQAKRLDDVDYRLPDAVLENHVGKPSKAMIGGSRRSSPLQETPNVIAAPLSRPFRAQAAVIQSQLTPDVRNES